MLGFTLCFFRICMHIIIYASHLREFLYEQFACEVSLSQSEGRTAGPNSQRVGRGGRTSRRESCGSSSCLRGTVIVLVNEYRSRLGPQVDGDFQNGPLNRSFYDYFILLFYKSYCITITRPKTKAQYSSAQYSAQYSPL